MVNEPGGSRFISMEIRKIDEIIRTLDDLWFFICRDSTGDYKKLIENDAALLIEELKKTLPKVEAKIDEKFVPSGDTQPTVICKIRGRFFDPFLIKGLKYPVRNKSH